MKVWTLTGRSSALPPDWRARLATRLGGRPRRLGAWVELALYGALQCMDDAAEARLPDAALLTVASLHGPDIALRAALVEARDGLPLPIGFLASLPGQVLPALAHHLGWHGDGRCLATREPLTALRLALLEAGAAGLLAGWVDEDAPGHSSWLRLIPAAAPAIDGAAAPLPDFAALFDPAVRALGLSGGTLYALP